MIKAEIPNIDVTLKYCINKWCYSGSCVKTINPPNNSNIIIIGTTRIFFNFKNIKFLKTHINIDFSYCH